MTAKLRMGGVSKSFPGVKALDDVSISVNSGEVLGLVGVNGAGKSTLMNILGGIYEPGEGRIEIDGQPVELHRPMDADQAGIAFIHQELLFFPTLTVAENMFVSHLPSGRLPFTVDKRAARKDRWRVPEAHLHLLSLLGGWPGAILAQQKLRHKTVKRSFRFVFWITVILNVAGLVWLLSPQGSGITEALLNR